MKEVSKVHSNCLVRFLSGLLLISFYFQLSTFERIKGILIRDASVSAYSLGMSSRLKALLGAVGFFDILLVTLLVAWIIHLVVLEIRSRRISREIAWLLDSDKRTLLLLSLFLITALRFYFTPGTLFLGDSCLHVQRAYLAGRSLAEGKLPFWTFYNYAGYPFLMYYGPLFYILSAATAVILGSLTISVKMWLFIFHFSSAIVIYFWVREIGLSRWGALVSGLAYGLTFQHIHTVVWTGALPVSAIFLFLPLVLLSIEKILGGSLKVWFVILVVSTSALILTHQGYAVYSLQLISLYVVLKLVLTRCQMGWRRFVVVVAGIGSGILVCSFFLWPVLFRTSGIYYPKELPLLVPAVPGVDFLWKILKWNNMWSGWTIAYIGVSFFLYTLLGSVFAWRKNDPDFSNRTLRSITIVALFAFLSASSGGRVLNLALPFFAVLSSYAGQVAWRRSRPGLFLLVLIVLCIDLGSTTIQSPCRKDWRFISEGMKGVSSRVSPHRVIYGYSSRNGIHFFNWADGRESDMVLLSGFFPQGAPHSLNSITAAIDLLNESQPNVPELARDILYLWDVAGLVAYGRGWFVCPPVEGLEIDDGEPPIAWNLPISPVVFSTSLAVADDDTLNRLDKVPLILEYKENEYERKVYLRHMMGWVRRMNIRRGTGAADLLLVRGVDGGRAVRDSQKIESLMKLKWSTNLFYDPERDGSWEVGMDRVIELKEYKVDMYRVVIKYISKLSGYIRIAFSWHPMVRVFVDGKEIEPLSSLFGAIVVPAEKGLHSIELVPIRRIEVAEIVLFLAGLLIVVITLSIIPDTSYSP